MTITGRQIREARGLLNLQRNELAALVKTLTTATIVRAEAVDDGSAITSAQASAIRRVLERAGIEFISDPPGARLQAVDPT